MRASTQERWATAGKVAVYLLAALLAVGMVIVAAGCKHHAPPPGATVQAGLGGAVAHIAAADEAVVAAKPHANKTGKELLTVASQQHVAAAVSVSEASKASEADLRELASLRASHERLETRWFVRWGKRVEWAFWILAIGFVGINVLAAFTAPMGGVAGVVGRWLITGLPGMNLAAAVARRLSPKTPSAKKGK